MDNKLEVGAIVKLKSGGPLMTVLDVLDNGKVNCVWFPREDSEPVHLGGLPPLTLERQQGAQPSNG
jgi:uncharacterized protein YodC (DUF2158 family)